MPERSPADLPTPLEAGARDVPSVGKTVRPNQAIIWACGLLGVILGFGAFLYFDAHVTGHGYGAIVEVAAGLVIAAVLAFIFDHVRQVIGGESAVWHLNSAVLVTIFMLEMFIVSGHELVSALVDPESILRNTAERLIGQGDAIPADKAMAVIFGLDLEHPDTLLEKDQAAPTVPQLAQDVRQRIKEFLLQDKKTAEQFHEAELAAAQLQSNPQCLSAARAALLAIATGDHSSASCLDKSTNDSVGILRYSRETEWSGFLKPFAIPLTANPHFRAKLRDVLARQDLFTPELREAVALECFKIHKSDHAPPSGANKNIHRGCDAVSRETDREHSSANAHDLGSREAARMDSSDKARVAQDFTNINRDRLAVVFPSLQPAPRFGMRALLTFGFLLAFYALLAAVFNQMLAWLVLAREPPAASLQLGISGVMMAIILTCIMVLGILALRSAVFLYYLAFDTPSTCTFTDQHVNLGAWTFIQYGLNAIPAGTVFLSQNGIPGWISVLLLLVICGWLLRQALDTGGFGAFVFATPIIGLVLFTAAPTFRSTLFLGETAFVTWAPIALLFSILLPYLRPLAPMPRKWAPAALAVAMALAVATALGLAGVIQLPKTVMFFIASVIAVGLWNAIRSGSLVRDAYIWLGLACSLVLAVFLALGQSAGTFLGAFEDLQSTLSVQQALFSACHLSADSAVSALNHQPARWDAYGLEISIVASIGFFTTLNVLAAWAQRQSME